MFLVYSTVTFDQFKKMPGQIVTILSRICRAYQDEKSRAVPIASCRPRLPMVGMVPHKPTFPFFSTLLPAKEYPTKKLIRPQ
jgi:hypothetical protein